MRGFIANILIATAILFTIPSWGQAQKEPVLDLSIPQNYRIGGITVLGAEYTDVQAVKLFSALQIGANITIPGDDIGRAIKNLWDQDLFADIQIEVAERRDNDVYLVIRVEELPRLTRYSISCV